MRPSQGALAVAVVAAGAAVAVAGRAAFGASPMSSPRAVRAARPQATRGVVVIDTNLSYQGAAAAGTGMVIGSDGVVLTNNHVIRGATTIRVRDPRSGRRYTAGVVGYDVAHDIAVLKLLHASGLATVTLGNSAAVHRGEAVTAVGNAGGTGRLVAASGTITALARAITVQDDQGGSEHLRGLIQTDANLQPGDSGGPLLDGAGRVVGIDTAASVGFAFRSGANVGFAIPIARALALARQIEASRSSATVHIGPTAFLGVSVDTAGGLTGGALVGQVVSGGPADQAGLTPGDVITAIDGRAVTSAASVVPLLQAKKPGDAIGLRWVDAFGNQSAATVQLASGPPQ